jgi:membrane protease YdiL (CAAX protease family)
MRSRWARLEPSQSALLEVGLLFLPGIPAYLWLWPFFGSTDWLLLAQSVVYLYFLLGTLFIGLRRWDWGALGVNRQGIGFSLGCGLVLLVGRHLVLFSTDIPRDFPGLDLERLILDILFYFLLVGLVEELLFRGLIYRAFDDWRGHRWAIWGSATAFGFYHIGASGLAGVAGGVVVGLIFGLIRWRAGGILGLVLVHGLIDVAVVEANPQLNSYLTSQLRILYPGLLILGYGLLMALILYLWKMPARKRI